MSKAKKILITGATSGVGLMLAKTLHEAGYEIWATGRNTTVLNSLSADGIHTIEADLTSVQSFDSLFIDMKTPDSVIHCAGVGTFSYLLDMDEGDMEKMLQVNVLAPMKLTKYFAQKMKTRGSGHFIFVASQAGKVATPKASVYAASKHAILGFANAIRMELKEFGVNVTTINPGPIDTPFLDLADETGNYRSSMKEHLLTPEKVVASIEQVIEKPVREVDLPSYMGITSKLYAIAPSIVETVGKKYFTKK
ncbi:SDR family NAD(P)-dependent oxidoreductase [Psychrobacillus sp. INOP01]|uniref:SDR family NAD(P)-dependent oxidoreductase n=1 Tax=Psychrobacillus sp. INOP01 TaxID=2829187 RepID=UPI001BAC4B33|nr:SDR family NAD(P)-dependent oxidoreductase [Psychrobacillus sp. INOP01]QUG42004.1 SDR family NAD(P)-dependent oxidoreductase [Psychrobacillus sp. INOP01]